MHIRIVDPPGARGAKARAVQNTGHSILLTAHRFAELEAHLVALVSKYEDLTSPNTRSAKVADKWLLPRKGQRANALRKPAADLSRHGAKRWLGSQVLCLHQ